MSDVDAGVDFEMVQRVGKAFRVIVKEVIHAGSLGGVAAVSVPLYN